MSRLVNAEQARSLVTPKTRQKAAKVIGLQAAEKIARRIKDPEALEKALAGKLDAEREFAAEYKREFPHPGVKGIDARAGANSEEWCLAHGFAHRTVQRWCELLDEICFAAKKGQVVKKCWQLAELWQAANFMSESIEWYTPAQYLEAVRQTLGEIELDPASNEKANRTVKAKSVFTREQDGLRQDWLGRFFVNPPYGKTDDGKSLAAEFCNKAVAEYQCGNASAGIILVNSLHSQVWQAPLYSFPVCFVNHRIQFISGDGEENKNPTFQNIFIYLGNELATFAKSFASLGFVMVPYANSI